VVSFIGGGNRSTRRKPPIGTDCMPIGSCKSKENEN